MASWILGLLIAAAMVFAVRGIVKNKKNGRLFSCGGDCSHCSAGCGKSDKKIDRRGDLYDTD